MNEDTAKGTLDKITGKVKESVGHLTGDHELEAKGKLEQAQGATERTIGRTKDAGSEVVRGIDDATR